MAYPEQEQEQIDGIVVTHSVNGTSYSFNGGEFEQLKIVTAMAKLERHAVGKTTKWYTADMVKLSLTHDDFDSILDLIEAIQDDILDD